MAKKRMIILRVSDYAEEKVYLVKTALSREQIQNAIESAIKQHEYAYIFDDIISELETDGLLEIVNVKKYEISV